MRPPIHLVSRRTSTRHGLARLVVSSLPLLPCGLIAAAHGGAPLRVLISQESAPGKADFGSHILGVVTVFDANEGPAAFYQYDLGVPSSFNGPLRLEANRAHLCVIDTGLSRALCVVFDRQGPDNDLPGQAETRVALLDGAAVLTLEVQDDPGDVAVDSYSVSAGQNVVSAKNVWSPCCTDGFVVGGLTCGESWTFEFADYDSDASTPTIENITSLAAYSSDGAVIPLGLEEGRRTRLTLLPPALCAGDLNCDGVVVGEDVSILFGEWGVSDSYADQNGDGTVDAEDLSELLGLWGICR